MPADNIEQLILSFALQNAILHDGTAENGAVLGKIISERPDLKPKITELIPIIQSIIVNVNSMPLSQQKVELESLAPELLIRPKRERKLKLPELPGGSSDRVVMRLAPYPSGPLHIGNARMVILNDEYVKSCGGKLLLVFDDTIGSYEKNVVPDAYDLIKDSLDWLGVEYHDVIYKSDRLPLFYEWAEKLIGMSDAYVCECAAETLRENRARGIECVHRSRKTDENLDLWKRMLSGDFKEGDAVLRLKTSMLHKNPAFRDRALFRISNRQHPRLSAAQYRVWPLLEFSWAIDDHLLGVTHVLRGKDLIIEDQMEKHIWDVLGIRGPSFIHYGMLRIKETKLSKSKSKEEVLSGAFSGWDDPRTWSLQSLKKKGDSTGSHPEIYTIIRVESV